MPKQSISQESPAEKEQTFTISELAKSFSVTNRTIRHYEDLGLLHPRRLGQNRIYSRSDRTRLKLILRGKRLGFSLEESREIIDMYHSGDSNRPQLQRLLERVDAQKMRLQQQLDDIKAMLGELTDVEKNCRLALSNISDSGE